MKIKNVKTMGMVYANIELINSEDIGVARRGFIPKEEIRRMKVNALVHSGAYMMAISPTVKEQLGLVAVDKVNSELADGSVLSLEVVGPIIVRFENRRAACDAVVVPGGTTPVLLGAIPLEQMDVMIHPKEERLIVNPDHPIRAQLYLK